MEATYYKMKGKITNPNMATYVSLLPVLRSVARACGYALAVHGSMERDLDLIAVPWVADAASSETLVENLRMAAFGYIEYGRPGRDPTHMPHGRLAWSIHLGSGRYIDLSVMPKKAEG